MARCMSWGRSTCLTSTAVTFLPRDQCADHDPLGRVDPLPRGEKVVQLYLPRRPASSARSATSRRGILHLDDGLARVDDAEEDHGVDSIDTLSRVCLEGHVVGDRAQAHLHHLVDEGDQQDDARPLTLVGDGRPSRKMTTARTRAGSSPTTTG
jgi:hypothetical protein